MINNITSSCKSGSCGYTYDLSRTPTILSINPTQGLGSADVNNCQLVTIQCDGCVAGKENIHVLIGNTSCEVMNATETVVTCCPGKVILSSNDSFPSWLPRHYPCQLTESYLGPCQISVKGCFCENS